MENLPNKSISSIERIIREDNEDANEQFMRLELRDFPSDQNFVKVFISGSLTSIDKIRTLIEAIENIKSQHKFKVLDNWMSQGPDVDKEFVKWCKWRKIEFYSPSSSPNQLIATDTNSVKTALALNLNDIERADILILFLDQTEKARRSSHAEFGYFMGYNCERNKYSRVIIFGPKDNEWEIMYGLADKFCYSIDDVVSYLSDNNNITINF